MTDDYDNTQGGGGFPFDSELPYETWLEEAHRQVMLSAFEHVSKNGLPGEHHFYLTFRTDFPGVDIPSRLRAQYPHEMTIVLQHQFWNLKVSRETSEISVDLTFGGVSSTLVIPFNAITTFADPAIHLSLHFSEKEPETTAKTPDETHTAEQHTSESDGSSQVVSLDAFRKKGPSPG
ncbi:SspB family protein [Acetobacter sp. DsW_059]|uniref:SspB family protein n=1 Tax=Acetobacter sp. DsW_059 TaxID=1670661 RepID=UPI000A36A7F9|nr:ClpXP protease specificity-enhancing factor SspB [Acetobacter sp. DsW_059]OUJ11000.1 hypothetical protein HK25_03065 [Acetobacter sp. DsW_059]